MASRNIFSLPPTDFNHKRPLNKQDNQNPMANFEDPSLMVPLRSINKNPKIKYETTIIDSQPTFTSFKQYPQCSMMAEKPTLHRLQQPLGILDQDMPTWISVQEVNEIVPNRKETPNFKIVKMKTAKEDKNAKSRFYNDSDSDSNQLTHRMHEIDSIGGAVLKSMNVPQKVNSARLSGNQ